MSQPFDMGRVLWAVEMRRRWEALRAQLAPWTPERAPRLAPALCAVVNDYTLALARLNPAERDEFNRIVFRAHERAN
jgi:hypothetical protein